MSSVFEVNPAWLIEVAPHYHKQENLDKLGIDKKMPKERSNANAGHSIIKAGMPKGAPRTHGRS